MELNLKRCSFGFLIVLVGMTCQQSLAALTGEYLFENNTLDTSGFGRDGTPIGSPTFTDGLYKGSTSALLQDADGQSVELPANTDFIRNAPGATLMAWVRPDQITGTNSIVVANNGDTASGGGIGSARAIVQIAGGQFRALGRQADGGSSSNTTGGNPIVGNTYFVAGVFDYTLGEIRLYVDGMEVGSNTSTGWAANSADTANLVARIGSHANGTQEYWQGAIDGVRIFDEVMSPTDIFDLYNLEAYSPGDTNHDGVVGPEDLTPIRTNWRQTGKTFLEGNLTGGQESPVDFADFRVWKTAFLNAGSGSLADVDLSFLGAIPEPSAVCLLLIGCLFSSTWRGARRSAVHCWTATAK